MVLCEQHLKYLSQPVVVFTEEPHTHYSVNKIAELFGMKSLPIRANSNGEMCLKHLRESISDLLFKMKYLNVIVVANCGSIYSTAFDDI